MERNENLPPDSSYANSSDEPDENAFKLTRAKARALNKNLMQIPPLKIVSSDFSALIDKDLGSDEEDDDEYQPGDEEPPVNYATWPVTLSKIIIKCVNV